MEPFKSNTAFESALHSLINAAIAHKENHPEHYAGFGILPSGGPTGDFTRSTEGGAMPHLVFADKLSDMGDERAAIVRSHFAMRLHSLLKSSPAEFGWHTQNSKPVMISPDNIQLHDPGSVLRTALVWRKHPKGHVEYAPWLGWGVGTNARGIPQIAYQGVLPVQQARRIIEQHAVDPVRHLATFDSFFAPTHSAREKVVAAIHQVSQRQPVSGFRYEGWKPVEPLLPSTHREHKKYTPDETPPPLEYTGPKQLPTYRHVEGIPERYSLQTAASLQLSRWTGRVHPVFYEPDIDGPVKPTLYSDVTPQQALDWVRRVFHPSTSPQHLAAITGWLPGTASTIEAYDRGGGPIDISHTEPDSISFSTNPEHDPAALERIVTLQKPYRVGMPPVIHNDLMRIDSSRSNPYRGVSPALYLRQLRAAHEMGIPRVEYDAAWIPGTFSGAKHWPLIGGDGHLPSGYIATIPPDILHDADIASGGQFKNSQKISHLFMSPRAKQWYLANPVWHQGFMETHPGSVSRTTLEKHVADQSARFGMETPTPDSQHADKLILQNMQFHPLLHHPMVQHLLDHGELHPEYVDDYFTT